MSSVFKDFFEKRNRIYRSALILIAGGKVAQGFSDDAGIGCARPNGRMGMLGMFRLEIIKPGGKRPPNIRFSVNSVEPSP